MEARKSFLQNRSKKKKCRSKFTISSPVLILTGSFHTLFENCLNDVLWFTNICILHHSLLELEQCYHNEVATFGF